MRDGAASDKTDKPPEFVHLEAMMDMLERDAQGKFRHAHDPCKIGFMRPALESRQSFVQFRHKPLARRGRGLEGFWETVQWP